MTGIFCPSLNPLSTTVNSVCSSTTGPAAAPAPGAATAIGAAAVTPNFSSMALTSSDTSSTVIPATASMI